MQIPNFIKQQLTNDYIKSFLKSKKLSYSNANKAELLSKLETAIGNDISEYDARDFLATFFKYGSNRTIITSIMTFGRTNAINSKGSLENKLDSLHEPVGYFNDIENISDTTSQSDTLFYQRINYDEKGCTLSIDRGYYRDERVYATDEDGTTIVSYVKIFTWVDIDIKNKRFNVHTKDLTPNYFGRNTTYRQTNQKFLDIHQKMFQFSVANARNEERTLYNIYKEMTDTAEAPFKEKITEEIKNKVKQLFLETSNLIGYNIDRDTLKIPNRVERLFERGLINQQYDLYSMYEEGKVGIIKRIVFYDGTGANVSAMVKEISENISSYDIYFDTRDTLDERKALNKLWAFWYYKSSLDSKEEKYEVKMEIEEDYYITHFLRKSILEEVVEYVFQQFREFEVLDT